jgi:hypothetical protein
MPFQKGHKTRAFNLTEAQIRYAMAHSKSNASAAKFLNIGYRAYCIYAKSYVDSATGKTLHEIHRSTGKGIPHPNNIGKVGHGKKLEDILDGKFPDYPTSYLKKRLMQSNIIPCLCGNCGMSERRLGDHKAPLLLDFKDGDRKNMHRDNLGWLCFNCVFLIGTGNPKGGPIKKFVYFG